MKVKRPGRGDKHTLWNYVVNLQSALYFGRLKRMPRASWRQDTENPVFGEGKDNKAEIKGR